MNDWDPRANVIFLQAIEIASSHEREAFVEEACGVDAGLRARVASLLEADEHAGDFLEAPAASPTVTADPTPPSEGPGTAIGPYKLLERIGEGGMGAVYMAEQVEPVRRKVALKLIKP